MANYNPTAVGHSRTVAAGQFISLSTLFTYSDLNGYTDVVSFTVTDATAAGGHFYHNGNLASSGTWGATGSEVPLSQIASWYFVAGAGGQQDTLHFTATDNEDGFNHIHATAKVTGPGVVVPPTDDPRAERSEH